jgi:GH24 family phage-related lysozyme (muramidase)
MIDASMTIKGDPYWLEGYMSPAMVKKEFGNIGKSEKGLNASTTLNGSNGLILMSGIAKGTDLHDNVLKRNLITSLSVVTVVSSSYSQGIFTQTLKMRKNTEAEHMATVVAEIDLEEIEKDDTNDATGGPGQTIIIPSDPIKKDNPEKHAPNFGIEFNTPLRDRYGTGVFGPDGIFIPDKIQKISNTGGSITGQSSPGLIAYVKRKENFTATAFWDNKQYTNGYGTKAKSSTETISEHEATRRLIADLNTRKTYVSSYGHHHGYTWDNNQVESMTSFAHNLGTGKVGQVTNNGTRTNGEIAEAMKLYNKANGVVLPGLTTRRNEESAWFRRGIGVGV